MKNYEIMELRVGVGINASLIDTIIECMKMHCSMYPDHQDEIAEFVQYINWLAGNDEIAKEKLKPYEGLYDEPD